MSVNVCALIKFCKNLKDEEVSAFIQRLCEEERNRYNSDWLVRRWVPSLILKFFASEKPSLPSLLPFMPLIRHYFSHQTPLVETHGLIAFLLTSKHNLPISERISKFSDLVTLLDKQFTQGGHWFHLHIIPPLLEAIGQENQVAIEVSIVRLQLLSNVDVSKLARQPSLLSSALIH